MVQRSREFAPRKKRALSKAFAITLISLGGVTIIQDLHILEEGVVNISRLIEIPPEPSTVSSATSTPTPASGLAIRCDPRWTVGSFGLAWDKHLETPVSRHRRIPEPDGDNDDAQLVARIDEIAAGISREAPGTDILLFGSGDSSNRLAHNAGYAQRRAQTVQRLLGIALRRQALGRPPPNIVVANDVLTEPTADGASSDGLARLLYGEDERSSRSVKLCLLSRPGVAPQSTASGANPPVGYSQSLVAGLGAAMVFMVVGLVAAFFLGVIARSLVARSLEYRQRALVGGTEPPTAAAPRPTPKTKARSRKN